MARIPSETFYDFATGAGVDIPATELAELRSRMSALELSNVEITSTVSSLNTRIGLMENELYRREYVFKASSEVATINGGYWRIGGLYRVFESLELLSVRGYSMNWPSGSSWQVIAMRTSGAQEVQNITSFMFEVVPPFATMNFEAGDVLGVLVRNFTTGTTEEGSTYFGEDNIAMSSMVFRKRSA